MKYLEALLKLSGAFFVGAIVLNLIIYNYFMKGQHFPVIVETDEDGIFIVSCPTFKGCHADGKTIDEALSNLKEVIEICIEEQPTLVTNQFIGVREMEVILPVSA